MKKKIKNIISDPVFPDCDGILNLINSTPHPLTLDAIMRLAHVPRRSKRHILGCLRELTAQHKLIKPSSRLWASSRSLKTLEGQFGALFNGGGFVKTADGEEFYIHSDDVNEAWHKDIVRIAVLPKNRHDEKQYSGKARKARIIQVVRRILDNIPVQIIKRTGRSLLCRPVDRRLQFNISLTLSQHFPDDLSPGHLLLVAPGKRLASNLHEGRLVEILGKENDVQVQENMVKLNHDVPKVFPQEAMEQAAALPDQPLPSDMNARENMCDVPFVTIDGADARDFDDAIHVCRKNDQWILQVAIADVSHYVQPDGKPDGLDAEAMRRGNSWYFPTSVEPMLPKALSNGLCSLAPRKKRLAIQVEIPFDSTGAPGTPRFAPIVMQSWGRLTYENVQRFFDSSSLPIPAENEEQLRDAKAIEKMLLDARELYKILALSRKRRGTIDFDLPEPKYKFTKDGQIQDIAITERNDAHKLIEEFMIAANEAVARHLSAFDIPFLYRVHPFPEETKLANLFSTLESTALEHLPAGIMENGHPIADAMQKIISAASGTSAEYVVNRLCLRAMPQARYQPENIGHFGLASKAYCHFTSPIRRYADLLVHRALKIAMGISADKIPSDKELQEIGNQLNTLERKAMECERDMARRMGCLLLKGHEGEIFDASVSGVTDFGIFVELDSMPLEGLIRLDDLVYDWFELDIKTQSLIGQKTGQLWKLGQTVRVRLESADMARLELRFLPYKMNVHHMGPIRKRRARHDENKDANRGKHKSTQKHKEYSRKKSGNKKYSPKMGKTKDTHTRHK